MKKFSNKENWNSSYHISSVDTNADRGWGHAADGSISLTKFPTPIFGIIMIGFGLSFFSYG
jgi:hypothetical protein